MDPSLCLVGLLTVLSPSLSHLQVSSDRLSAHVDVDTNDLRNLLLTHFASDVIAMAGGEDFIDLSQVSALVFHDRMMWSGKPEDSIIVPIN